MKKEDRLEIANYVERFANRVERKTVSTVFAARWRSVAREAPANFRLAGDAG